jgi:hypothetical protein
MSLRTTLLLATVTALVGGSAVVAQNRVKTAADENESKSAAPRPVTKKTVRVAITPGREAAAMTFAKLHHPELSELLVKLKKGNRREYDRAVRALYLTSERLARFKTRFPSRPERHELALQAWKLDSRIKLLAARMAMSADKKLEAELKAALVERVDVRQRELELERDRLRTRLESLDKSIERLTQNRETLLKKDFQRVKRGLTAISVKGAAARNKKPRRKTSTKPGTRKSPESKTTKPTRNKKP